MNTRQTKVEAQRLLMLHSTPEEGERLRAELPARREGSEPEHISNILPRVMADIRRRMERKAERLECE